MTEGQRTILALYCRYQSRGGEDEVFESEVELLRQHGLNVVPVTATPSPPGRTQLLRASANVVWSVEWHRKLRQLSQAVKPPPVVHIHNTFPTMSPSVIHAARQTGAAIVHTLHNYRLICPSASCYRDGHTCEDCVTRTFPWPGILHGCYKGSHLQTAGVATMVAVHSMLKTWQDQVDVYVAPTTFSRDLLARGGVPIDKIVVKPNFLAPDPGIGNHGGDFCLFVGRLSDHKGIRTLLRAWAGLRGISLKIVGDPLPDHDVETSSLRLDATRVDFLGRLSRAETLAMMKESRLLIVPSEWYEVHPLTVVEAFACGLPVLASRLGAMAEVVDDGRTGLHFTPGDSDDLASKVEWAWEHRDEMATMAREARRTYETRYTAEPNFKMLTRIYELALSRRLDS